MARKARRTETGVDTPLEARLRLLLASGGDDRIWPDPVSRRNRYGATADPAPGELWFSSSTASAISPRGWSAAREALARLIAPGPSTIVDVFDGLRRRLLALYGAPGAEAVLSASGTEAELVTLSLSLALAGGGPLVNIVVAPAETGSGVPAAASGRHFLGQTPLGGAVDKRRRLVGWEGADLALEAIEIRDACGAPRPMAEIDAEAAERTARAVAAGAFAVLHVLDASKTGRPGVSREAARAILADHPGRVLVVVDACQLRSPAEALRRDLSDGFAVMLTGSKFAAGPAFCGVLLLPAALVDELATTRPAASPLAPYSAALDWPKALRWPFAAGLSHPANLGLGLRWTAALAEIEAYEAVPAAERAALLAQFGRAVAAHVAADPGLALLEDAPAAPGLIPIIHADGSDPRPAYEALARGDGGARPCHLGQPVVVGARTALRVCASMPMIVGAAQAGFASIQSDLNEAFDAWARLRG
ncbi:MAG TPA: hypothetical protein VHW60_03075 [Caulobacteraceae bacterium]|nr:hypothetical protein [Caulobacteraceae bacterium]